MKDKYTIMLPVAKNLNLANDCINHLLKVTDIPIIVIDDNGKDSDYENYNNSQLKFIHNNFSERQSLVKIWNQCIKECPTENIIIASWRPRPTQEHFLKIDEKLKEGFALVDLKTLHFFAIQKQLTAVIGWFDTGFTAGQYEDTDFYNRLFSKNLGVYISDEITEVPYPSMWTNGGSNLEYYNKKWTQKSPYLIQNKEEENIEDRSLYKNFYTPKLYKSFSESIITVPGISNFYKNLFPTYIKNF